MTTSINFETISRGFGGYCDKYAIDSLEVSGVVVAVRYTDIHKSTWGVEFFPEYKPYYEIPVSVENQAALIAAFSGLDIVEDEPGAVVLHGADDETAVMVGMFAAQLDGDLPTDPTNEGTEEPADRQKQTVYFTESGYYGKQTVPMIREAVKSKGLHVVELTNGWYMSDRETFEVLYIINLVNGGYTTRPDAA